MYTRKKGGGKKKTGSFPHTHVSDELLRPNLTEAPSTSATSGETQIGRGGRGQDGSEGVFAWRAAGLKAKWERGVTCTALFGLIHGATVHYLGAWWHEQSLTRSDTAARCYRDLIHDGRSGLAPVPCRCVCCHVQRWSEGPVVMAGEQQLAEAAVSDMPRASVWILAMMEKKREAKNGLGLLVLWPLPLAGAEGGHRSLCALFRHGGP
ncbi:uncharacterized protein TrAtP1_001738 [Trichoderma atroviride]|uniref:uncharacterized protein n=1 Tax=Hypocrea atroviridis TaxID=63577 RepID=UPI00331A3CC8|nr:hypothetical protein TrAtP1_001738 [Trichoderma atroviride]